MDKKINMSEIIALDLPTKWEIKMPGMFDWHSKELKQLVELAEKKVKQFLNQTVEEGIRVILTGLKNAKHLNGVQEKILKFHDEKNQYEIQLLSKQNQIFSVHYSNFEICIEKNEEEEVRAAKKILAIVHHLFATYVIHDPELCNTYYAKALKYFSSQFPNTSECIDFCNDYL